METDDREFEIDAEFMSDEEVEKMLENLVIIVDNETAAEDGRVAVIDPYRIRRVLYAYKTLKDLTKGTAKVSCFLNEPCMSMGVVRIVGSELLFGNIGRLIKAVEAASKIEVYPKTDGTLQMDVIFYGLTEAFD